MADVVSIVIPTRNGMATLPEVFEALAAQEGAEAVEIVAVDSGSTDGTLEFLAPRVRNLIDVAPGEFNHGLTRNLAIARTRGPLVVLLVQDAIPVSASWLVELIRPLREDPRVAGSFARQRPRADAGPLTRRYLAQWVASADVPEVKSVETASAFAALSPGNRHLLCAFDNVCSCVRRSVWEQYPFRATTIAEDLEWAREVLLGGYRLAYAPAACVVHSHDRSVGYEFRRTREVHERLQSLFGLATVPDVSSLLREIDVTVPRHVRWMLQDDRHPTLGEMVRAIGLGLAFPLGQYLGARSADRTAADPARPRSAGR